MFIRTIKVMITVNVMIMDVITMKLLVINLKFKLSLAFGRRSYEIIFKYGNF